MQKEFYQTPMLQVISLAPVQETLQTTSVNVMAIGASDLSTPSEISGTWESLF